MCLEFVYVFYWEVGGSSKGECMYCLLFCVSLMCKPARGPLTLPYVVAKDSRDLFDKKNLAISLFN